MSVLEPALKGSRLAAPLVTFSTVPENHLGGWLSQSRLGQVINKFLAGCQRFDEATSSHLMWLVIIGILTTFIISTYKDTEFVGVATVFLFGIVVLRTVFGKSGFMAHITIIDALVFAYFASALLSTAFSSYLATSLVGLAKGMVFFASYLAFRAASHFAIHTKDNKPLYFLLTVLALLGCAQSLIGFYQYINHIEPRATWVDPSLNPELQMTRIFGTLQPSNPNLLAGFLIPCLASSLGFAFITFDKQRWVRSAIFVGISAIILSALVLTGSRGAYLAIAAMLAAWFAIIGHMLWHDPQLREHRKLKTIWLVILIGSVLAVALAAISFEPIRHRIVSIFAMRNDSSISYRLNVYNSVWQMIQHNWLVGIGPGNGTFKQVYGLYMIPGYNALGAYSVPLEIAVEQGIIGFGIFMMLLVTILIRAMLGIDHNHATITLSDKLLLALLFTGILGSIVYGFFDTIWYRPAVNLPFWFFVAAFAVQSERLLHPHNDSH